MSEKRFDVYARTKALLHDAGVEDAAFDADALLAYVTGQGRFGPRDELSEEEARQVAALAARRAAREPLQYLLGRWPFLGIQLAVGPGVLIPRPETEEVCAAAGGLLAARAEEEPRPGAVKALDLCSGTGALALGLQSFVPGAAITAVELSPAAHDYLCRNIEAYKLGQSYESADVDWDVGIMAPKAVQADALDYHRQLKPASLDLIVCNPPYVTETEYEGLAPELLFEPKMALVPPGPGAGDGLSFYRAIARDYHAALRAGGWLVFEVGAAQSDAVVRLMEEAGYHQVEQRADMAGHPRMVLGCRV